MVSLSEIYRDGVENVNGADVPGIIELHTSTNVKTLEATSTIWPSCGPNTGAHFTTFSRTFRDIFAASKVDWRRKAAGFERATVSAMVMSYYVVEECATQVEAGVYSQAELPDFICLLSRVPNNMP
jgi:hypothetical protein